MIYVCVAAHNDESTVGLLLWKVRQVFAAFPREYQLLVVDDASSDSTAEVLDRYQRALPMTILRHTAPRGMGASLDALLREALRRSDRPRRDVALVLPADFSISPDGIPELLRRIESGADLVVGEAPARPSARAERLVLRLARWLLRPGIQVPGVRDLLSGCLAVRLVAMKQLLRERAAPLLGCDGLAARAELVACAAGGARQIAVVDVPSPAAVPASPRRPGALRLALQLARAGRTVRIPLALPRGSDAAHAAVPAGEAGEAAS
jgi:glycosyltransferase involved in cell wall biosynthesis